jgi:hypothetical protein
MAWATVGSFWVKSLAPGAPAIGVPVRGSGDAMQSLVRHLLAQWAQLPAGVYRIVAFRTVPLSPSWDPRCL